MAAIALCAGVITNLDTIFAFFGPDPAAPSVPPITLKLSNSGEVAKLVAARSDFYLWLPGGSGHHTVGKYELRSEDQEGLVFSIEPKSEQIFSAHVLNPFVYEKILVQGECDLSLGIRNADGGILLSDSLPFTRDSIAKYFVAVDVAREPGRFPSRRRDVLDALAEQARIDPPYYGDSVRGNVRPQMEAYVRSFVFDEGCPGVLEAEGLLRAIAQRAFVEDPEGYFVADNAFRAALDSFRSRVRHYARTDEWPED